MKKTKIAAIALVSAMMFSTMAGVTGCNKKGGSSAVQNEVVEVEEDSLWFDYTKTKIELLDTSKYEDVYTNGNFTKVNDGYIVAVEAYPLNYEGSAESYVIELDKNGNVTNKALIDANMLGLEDGTEMYLGSVSSNNGNPIFYISTFKYDEKTGNYESGTILYDYNNKKKIDLSHLEEKMGKDSFSTESGILDDGYEYLLEYAYNNENEVYKLHLGQNGKFIKTIDINKESNLKELYGAYSVSYNKGVISLNVYSSNADKLMKINLSDYSISLENMSYSEGQSFVGDDGKEYIVKTDGIYCGEECVVPYDCSYVNAANVSYATILSADGENFTLSVSDWSNDEQQYYFYTFNKADKNPNVGKDIITVGMVGYLDSLTCEAISEFNESSDDYFIKMKNYITEYDESDYEGSEDWTSSDYQKHEANKQSEMANELTMDLLNGEGPDIIVGAYAYPQLNNEEYLVDLSSFISDDLKDIDLFDNVIDASKVDEKIYQLPLGFYISGIAADSKDVKGESGFTFDEYKEYVDDVCNGKNPVAKYSDRIDVFNTLIAAMSSEFTDEKGNVSFKNDAFYQVAEYCKDNVPETYEYEDYGDDIFYSGHAVGYSYGGTDSINQYNTIYDASQYLSMVAANRNVKIYGIPSIDGRGPSITVQSSIAISAAVSNEDAAKEFIKFIMNNDNLFVDNLYANPIIVSACETNAKKSIDSNNKQFEQQLKWSTEAELNSWGTYKYDYEDIDSYIDTLKSASCISELDPSIMVIIMEEIPAYFAGQKTIEDVASVIEDRAQTVIDERG